MREGALIGADRDSRLLVERFCVARRYKTGTNRRRANRIRVPPKKRIKSSAAAAGKCRFRRRPCVASPGSLPRKRQFWPSPGKPRPKNSRQETELKKYCPWSILARSKKGHGPDQVSPVAPLENLYPSSSDGTRGEAAAHFAPRLGGRRSFFDSASVVPTTGEAR